MEEGGAMSSQQEGPRTKGKRPSIAIVLASLVLVLVLVSTAVVYAAMDVDWRVERVREGSASWPFLAVDVGGTLHMTYYSNGSLYYSTQTDDGWDDSVIVTGAVHWTAPVAFDADGDPHVCYQIAKTASDPNNYTLECAEWAGGEWTSSIVSADTYPGSESMAIGPDGVTYVAFVRLGDLICADDRNGSWDEDVLVDHPDAPRYILEGNTGSTSIAIDASGNVHVALGYNQASVIVFSDGPSDWNRSIILSSLLTFNSVSLLARDDGALLLAYYAYPTDPEQVGLWMATRTSGAWVMEPVSAARDLNSFTCSLTVDHDGAPVIAWYGSGLTGSHIMMSRQTGDGWESCVVIDSDDLSIDYRASTTVCVDAEGTILISVNRGAAEFVTDSVSFAEGLSAVRFLAVGYFAMGLLVWGIGVAVARRVLNRERKNGQG